MLVGDVSLLWASETHRQGELGFVFHPLHQGRGYATEAARPILAFAFEELALHRVIGRLEPRNVGSARVLEKLGMRREAHLVESEGVKGEWQSELSTPSWRASGAPLPLAGSGTTADTDCSHTTEVQRMPLTFGVTVLPDPPASRLVELMQLGEENGFEIGWTYDSHVLWQESFIQLTLAIQATSTMKFGHLVTNPGTREPTVLASLYATMHDVSNGRMVMGIGRGDSARRYIGQPPVRVAEFERRLTMIKDFMNGREVHWNDKDLHLKWVRPELPEIPLWVAGYGPKALGVAGRVGDGVIIQLADPEIIQWIMGTARAAAAEAGRDPAALKCIVCAPSHVGPIEDGREQTRWFPAMVSNHVKDLIERYGTDGSVVPKALTDYVEARKFYDYDEHSRVGAKHGAFVTDEICDRFSVLGDVGQITTKLRELESIGVDHYSIYLMTEGQEATLEAYGGDVIPELAGAAA